MSQRSPATSDALGFDGALQKLHFSDKLVLDSSSHPSLHKGISCLSPGGYLTSSYKVGAPLSKREIPTESCNSEDDLATTIGTNRTHDGVSEDWAHDDDEVQSAARVNWFVEMENLYAAHIVGDFFNEKELMDPIFYMIEVTGPNFYHEVRRTFSQFLRLDRHIRPKFPNLPPMPPRSAIRKFISPSFMRCRQEALSKLLDAAVSADPNLSDMDLRRFLSVDYFGGSMMTFGAVDGDGDMM